MSNARGRYSCGLCTLFLLALALAPVTADVQTTAPAAKLRVLTKPAPPFVSVENGKPVGFSIDLWDAVAREAGLEYEFQVVNTVGQMIDGLKSRHADAAIAALSVTADREAQIDFSHPYMESGLQVLTSGARLGHHINIVSLLKIVTPQLIALLGLICLAMLAAAHLLWYFERKHNPKEFPESYANGVWEALWWTLSIVITGGCENIAPRGVGGRIVGVLWMLTGIMLVSFLTASFATAMTVDTLSSEISGPGDLVGRTVGTVQGTAPEQWARQSGAQVHSYPTLEEACGALNSGEVKAVVYDAPMLNYLLSKWGKSKFRLVGPLFEKHDYAVGVQDGSPLRKRINVALLAVYEKGIVANLKRKWLGEGD